MLTHEGQFKHGAKIITFYSEEIKMSHSRQFTRMSLKWKNTKNRDLVKIRYIY